MDESGKSDEEQVFVGSGSLSDAEKKVLKPVVDTGVSFRTPEEVANSLLPKLTGQGREETLASARQLLDAVRNTKKPLIDAALKRTK